MAFIFKIREIVEHCLVIIIYLFKYANKHAAINNTFTTIPKYKICSISRVHATVFTNHSGPLDYTDWVQEHKSNNN